MQRLGLLYPNDGGSLYRALEVRGFSLLSWQRFQKSIRIKSFLDFGVVPGMKVVKSVSVLSVVSENSSSAITWHLQEFLDDTLW